jgi:hypothetical protein
MSIKKTLLILLAFAVCLVQKANAQHKTHEDSTEVINAAHRYANGFRLRDKELEKFHTDHFPVTSDYFKPSSRFPKVLTNDSLFVKTYRLVAFDQVLDEKSFHPLLPPGPLARRPDPYIDPLRDIAAKDAQRFSLSKPLLARFKKEKFPAKSDYFKPVAANASDPSMLSDSAYVQTFRLEAYNRAVDQKVTQ